MTHTTAIINLRTIKDRCEVDKDGCWIWTRTSAGAKNHRPYWATYQTGTRKRVNVFLPRVVAELAGYDLPPKGHHVRMTCQKDMCLNPDCLHLRKPVGMFSQLMR